VNGSDETEVLDPADRTPIDPPDTPADLAAPAPLPRPRIRTGAVIWGLVLVALAAAVLWVASSPGRRDRLADAVFGLDALGWTVLVVIAVGGTLTLIALAAVLRGLQRRIAGRRRGGR